MWHARRVDAAKLEALLQTETERVEWKQSVKDGDGVVEAVCALANDLGATQMPGYVVVGVAKNGTVVGVDPNSLDDDERRLAGRIYDISLQPSPSVTLRHEQLAQGRWVIVVEVAPSRVPPAVTWKGVARVRVGTTTRRATDADLARLRERRPEGALPFDLRAVAECTLDDLETDSLRARHADARDDDDDSESFPALEHWLVQQDLGRWREGRFVPTATALLVFGKDPQARLPGAYVDLVRYAGTDVDATVAHRLLARGTVPNQLDALWQRLHHEILTVPRDKRGIVEGFVEEYPFAALEELVRNLVQHRAYDATNAPSRVEWFDDRVELTNPGGPFGQASEGELGAHSDYRNPTLTRHLSELGYVQKLGRGLRRVRAQLERHGCPPLEVETDGYTRIVVRRRPS